MPRRVAVDAVEPDPHPQKGTAFSLGRKQPEASEATEHEILQKASNKLLSAFMVRPEKIAFSEVEPPEELILFLRAHPITNVPWIVISLVVILIPLILLPFLVNVGVVPSLGVGLTFAVTAFWFLGTFTYAFISFLYWYFNVYIVTNERIIDVDWYSVIYRKVSGTQISKIQDASAVQAGVLASLFDFGDVQIQTAAEEKEFEFASVPHPQLVTRKIQELMAKEEKESDVKDLG